MAGFQERRDSSGKSSNRVHQTQLSGRILKKRGRDHKPGLRRIFPGRAGVEHIQPIVENARIRHAAEEVDVWLEHEIVVVVECHRLVRARAQA